MYTLAAIQIIDGEIVVDLGNTKDYKTIKTENGVVCIVQQDLKEKVLEEINGWDDYKKEAYNEMFANSTHSKKIDTNKTKR